MSTQNLRSPSPEPLKPEEMDAIDAMYARLGASYYDLLGLPRDFERPAARAAYFNLMKRFHPDVFWERDLELYRPRVEAIFKALTLAFEVLCDARRRADYDATLAPARPPSRPAIPPPRGSQPAPRVSAPAPRVPTPAPRRPESSSPPAPAEARDDASREVTRQSLQRLRSGYVARASHGRRAELEELVRQAELRNDAAAVIAHLREAAGLAPNDEALRARLEQAEAASASVARERYRNAARMYEKDGCWDLAAAAWVKACQAAPDDLALHLAMVRASCEGGVDLQRAAEYARRATRLAPTSADAYALQGRVFLLAGRMASARGSVDAALRLDPSHAGALELAGRLKGR